MVPANLELDAIDLKILAELQADARIPNITLAERVGLSPSPCSRRVKLLEEQASSRVTGPSSTARRLGSG